jgi:hypothetical protein
MNQGDSMKRTAPALLAAHNISPRGRSFGGGNAGYYDYMKGLPDFETSMAAEGSSLAVSFKKK